MSRFVRTVVFAALIIAFPQTAFTVPANPRPEEFHEFETRAETAHADDAGFRAWLREYTAWEKGFYDAFKFFIHLPYAGPLPPRIYALCPPTEIPIEIRVGVSHEIR